MKLTIDNSNIIHNLFLSIFLYLTGSYIGNIYSIFYKIYIFILMLNIIHFILTINKLYYYQNFSTEHPKKGDKIFFKLTIENRLPFMPAIIKVMFHNSLNISQVNPKFRRSKSSYIEDSFSLPYRGIYNVGIKKIICNDILNIFSYEIPFWPRTFYVYPKINDKISTSIKGIGDVSNKIYYLSSNSSDYLNGIKKFTNGNKLSLISWKHFALKEEPYIKDFYSENSSETYIFLDKTRLPDYRLGPADDLLIESLVSLTDTLIKNNHKVRTNEWKTSIKNFHDFSDFYKKTILIPFNNSPDDTISEFKSQKNIKESRLIVLTAFESSFFMDLEFINAYRDLTIFVITKNMNDIQIKNLNKTIEKYSKYVEIVCISD